MPSALLLVNPRKNIVAWAKRTPGLAVAAASGAFIVGWLGWLLLRPKLCGIFSQGRLVKGSDVYQITSEDMLWLARALLGEVSESSANWALPTTQRAGAAVLYALTNAYMSIPGKRSSYANLTAYVRAYCQPLSARWQSASSSGCLEHAELCTASHLARRARVSTKSWADMPMFVKTLVEQFVRGCLSNPIGRRTDWRATGFGYNPADALSVGGNVFGTSTNASGTVRLT